VSSGIRPLRPESGRGPREVELLLIAGELGRNPVLEVIVDPSEGNEGVRNCLLNSLGPANGLKKPVRKTHC
jgi:hypothetical protein